MRSARLNSAGRPPGAFSASCCCALSEGPNHRVYWVRLGVPDAAGVCRQEMRNRRATMKRKREPDRLEALRILGLGPTATRNGIKRAYRRLALRYHPDRNPKGRPRYDEQWCLARFREVSGAYAILERHFAAAAADGRLGLCDRCGDFEALAAGLDGNAYCRTCLLTAEGKRALPAPPIVIAGCGLTMAGLLASSVAMGTWLVTGLTAYWWCSVACCAAAMAALATLCLRVQYAVQPEPRRRRGRACRRRAWGEVRLLHGDSKTGPPT